jgi:hypothetical protein
MPRYVCIGFETMGFLRANDHLCVPAGCWPKSSYDFPIQLSVDIVHEDLQVTHAFDTLIRGAQRSCENAPGDRAPAAGPQP